MATYLELETLASDPDFHKRIRYSLKQKAYTLILANNKDKELISSLFNGNKWPVVLLASYIISHPLVLATGSAITDANLQTAVNTVYDFLTG